MDDRTLAEILRLLPLFCAVGEEGSVTAAADLLRTPQPTVSRSLARLGDLVGSPVVRRHGRGSELTAAGHALLPAAQEALVGLRETLQSVRRQHDVGSGQVSLAFQTILGEAVVPALIGRFRQRFPEVRFDLLQGSRQVCLDALATGGASIVLVADPPSLPGTRWFALYDEALVLVTAPTHRFATRSTVSLADLDGEPMIVLKPGFGLRAQLDALFAAAGIGLSIAFEVDDARTARGLADAGLGVCVVPAQRGEPSQSADLRIEDPRARRTIGCVVGPDVDATVTAFADFAAAVGRGLALAALDRSAG